MSDGRPASAGGAATGLAGRLAAAFLESKLGLTVPDMDLVPQNLDSVDKLVSYVERRRTAAS